jgi:hypothetical protein
MSQVTFRVLAFHLSKMTKIMSVSLIACLFLGSWIPGHCQTLSKNDLKEFQSGLKWEIKNNEYTSAGAFGAMQNALVKMGKNPTPVEVMASLETVTQNISLFDKFLYECVLSQRGNKNAAQQLVYKFCKSYALAIRCYDYIENKYGKLLTSELKQIDENARKERIENERKQKLEDEAEKAREAEEAKREEEDNRISDSVDIRASFPGGNEAWKKYMDTTLRAQVPTENGAPEATYTVYIQFVVTKDGGIRDIKPLSANGYGMEAEAMRVIRKQPRWQPAILNGKTVNTSFKQSITFRITSE